MAPPRFCIVSDLDHTMVDHEDKNFTSLLEFNRLWSGKFGHDSYLVFSTGRSQVKYEELRKEAPLLTPDLLICSVGTEIYVRTPEGQKVDDEWNAELDKGWNRDQIVDAVKSDFDKLSAQSDTEQRPHKVSYSLSGDGIDKEAYVQQLRDRLKGAGLAVKVVYSGGSDVDVLPECASKGLALQFLQKRWEKEGQTPSEGIQVNGDSGNDAELFEAPGVYGCVVGNAMEELVKKVDGLGSARAYKAKQRCAAGIIETMKHFKKIPDDSSLPPQAQACLALVNLYAFRMAWLNGSASGDGELQQQIGNRIASDFSKSGSDKDTIGRDALLQRTADQHGSRKDSPILMWLDRMRCESGSNGEVTVMYNICHKPVGGGRKPEKGYRAVLKAQDRAPETMALIKLESGVDVPQ